MTNDSGEQAHVLVVIEKKRKTPPQYPRRYAAILKNSLKRKNINMRHAFTSFARTKCAILCMFKEVERRVF